MYRYDEFDRHFVHQRAAQFRDQLERHLAGQLPDDDFRALRLQNADRVGSTGRASPVRMGGSRDRLAQCAPGGPALVPGLVYVGLRVRRREYLSS